MKVFLIKYSFHKGKWDGRHFWPVARIFAESEREAKDWLTEHAGGTHCGFRIHSAEDVTGKPHEIPFKTVF